MAKANAKKVKVITKKKQQAKSTTLMNTDEYRAMYEVEVDHWWYRGLRQILFFWINKLSPKKMLDAGAGTGINALEAVKRGYSVSVFDASPEGVEFCKMRGLEDVKLGFTQEIPFKNEEFDLITCMDVMVLLNGHNVNESMKEFRRCLKPGGHLIINSATLQWLYSQHDQACNTYKRWSKKEMERFMEDNGFKIVKSTYRIFLLFPIVALVKIFEKKNISSDNATNIKGDLEKTSLLTNKLLTPVMWIENFLLRFINLPIGSSHFVIGKKL